MTGMVRSPLVDFIELLKQNFVLYYLVLHSTIDSFHIALPVDCIVLSVCESVQFLCDFFHFLYGGVVVVVVYDAASIVDDVDNV